MTRKQLARRIRRARKLARKSTTEVAAACKVVERTIQNWEAAETSPPADMIPRLAAVLGCSAAYLFGERKEGK